jgi:very-short-patch-repair endonuclease
MSATNTPASPQEDAELRRLKGKLEAARKELLETTTRTRLLHTPLGSSRAKIIEIKDELAEQVFGALVREGTRMTFLAAPDNAEETEDGTVLLRQPEDDEVNEDGVARRHRDARLQTALPSGKLQGRLRSIAYDAQTFESEQGVNILYLAMGFLKWFEQWDPEKPRYAPLILVPVTLERASAASRFKVAYSGEELGTNLSLQLRLKDDEGITLPDLSDIDDLSPNAYFDAVAEVVAGLPKWEVLRDTIVLGFFSFAKLMMYRDLEPERWPLKGGLLDHAIISGLLSDGFRDQSDVIIPDETSVDTVIDIAAAGHVVDADSSQTVAIAEVCGGRNLVIQGPPGTGKSQTITNLIATAVREKKRVLFVAEKMAALNVVRANLDKVELGQICLPLHSHKAKKKAVLEDLEETFELAEERYAAEQGASDRLRVARDALNAHVKRVHAPLAPSAVTPFEVFAKLARLSSSGLEAPDFQLPIAQKWSRKEIEDRVRRVEALAGHVGVMDVPDRHPWRGTGLDVALPQDAERVSARCRAAHGLFEELTSRVSALAAKLGVPCETMAELKKLISVGPVLLRAPAVDIQAIGYSVWINSRARIADLVEHGLQFSQATKRLNGVLIPEAWDEDQSGIIKAFNSHGHSWIRWFKSDYRAAVARFRRIHVGRIPKLLNDRLEILETLGNGQGARESVRQLQSVGQSAFGRNWAGEKSPWALLRDIELWEREVSQIDLPAGWRVRLNAIANPADFAADAASLADQLKVALSTLQSLFADLSFDITHGFAVKEIEAAAMSEIRERLALMAASADKLQQWCTWRVWTREARSVDLVEVVDRLADGRLKPGRAADVFRYACYETLARQAFSEYPELQHFDGRSHEVIVAEFQELDRSCMLLARDEVAAQHVGMMPRGSRDVGEIGILAREWRKQRRHLPLRQLIKAAGHAMQLIKPVWMMSPMSLAQFVEPGALQFDLILMDEASQIRPVEALGAIARGSQIVVVGDDKQLPPTSFFDRVMGDEGEVSEPEEFEAGDVESILGLCAAQGIPNSMLRWHYRSQHESLIAVSNLEFYKKLFIVPSSHSDDLGLQFRKVPGIYDRGRTATNTIEAREVARAVVEHARRHRLSARFPGGLSLGVGTFSVAQRDAILDQLELLWRQDPELAAFFDPNAPEPFFVKNLESIQGDERDVVFISVGYGPDADGYVSMGFGPLSAQGGERRLNVLISRARRRCEIFSSISGADIDLSRTQSIGVRVLKTFLQYAETGNLERSEMGQRAVDSDFEEDVAASLAALGYQVEHQIGVAGFFVDLGVKESKGSGRYVLGIECDGATYHSSRSARDRDRIREQVLRDRGWRIHRIWSVDWYRRRQEELKRVIAAIEAARSAGTSTPSIKARDTKARDHNSRKDPTARTSAVQRDNEKSSSSDGQPTASQPYREASFVVQLNVEPHELPTSKLAEVLVRIVEIEGPIHEEEIGRRYAYVCGCDRAGGRIQEAARRGLAWAVRAGKLYLDGSFYSLKPLTACPPRDRSNIRSSTLRKPEMIPPVEVRTAVLQIVREHVGVEPQDAVVEVARVLGFQRTGAEVERLVEGELRALLADGVLALKNENRLYC